jgi:hypothetical protein
MKRACFALMLFFLTSLVFAGMPVPPLLTATGTVTKADADSVTIRPRGPEGKFGKALSLKVTGTSKVTVLTTQKRGAKLVFVQRDMDAKDLEANQHVAVIYTGGKTAVLLSAVAMPTSK